MAELLVAPLSVAIYRKGQSPIYGEGSIHVSVQDEAAGPFVELRGVDLIADGVCRLDLDELEKVTSVARELIRAHEAEL